MSLAPEHPRRRSAARLKPLAACLCAALALCLLLTAAPGCNILGPVVAVVSGPPTKAAAYELDPSRIYVIFVDDLRSSLPKRSLRDVIAQSAEEQILAEGLLPQDHLLSATATRRVAASETNENKMPIAEVGRRVGADVVIYITVDGFMLSRDGVSAMPTALSRMKIIDVTQNERIWPSTDEGYSVIVQPNRQQGDLPKDLSGRNALEVALAKRLGLAIAQTFYKHEVRQSATSN